MINYATQAPRDKSVNETCAILGVTPPTIYKLLADDKLDGYLVGRSRRITWESIERLRNGGGKFGGAA